MYIDLHSYMFITVEEFGGAYYVTAINDLCADKGKAPLENIRDCKKAARTVQDVHFVVAEKSHTFPTGCYALGKGVYFNNHVNGSREERSRSICRAIG